MFDISTLDLSMIADERHRTILSQDLDELQSAMYSGAYKTVIVLSGSLTEGILLSALSDLEVKPKGKKLEELMLGQLIGLAVEESILSEESSKMSDLVKDYRNLIHPGRLVRKQAIVDEHTAEISLTLLRLIFRDISSSLADRRGNTAEQMIHKIQNDKSFFGIASDLLRGMRQNEVCKLVTFSIPSVVFETLDVLPMDDAESNTRARTLLTKLSKLYQLAFAHLSDEAKSVCVESFAKKLKEESDDVLTVYEKYLFNIGMVKYASDSSRTLIINHILETIKDTLEIEYMKNCSGIVNYLTKDSVSAAYDVFINKLVYSKIFSVHRTAYSIADEFFIMTVGGSDIEQAVLARSRVWQSHLANRPEPSARFGELFVAKTLEEQKKSAASLE